MTIATSPIASPSSIPSPFLAILWPNREQQGEADDARVVEDPAEAPLVRLYACEKDGCVQMLHVCCRDQVGFLFKLSELLTKHGIHIENAEIGTVRGLAVNRMWLRAPRPSDFLEAHRWCHELEDVASQASVSADLEQSLAVSSKRLGVNLDLLSITSFQAIDSGAPGELRYRLELKGINQAGVLAYVSMVFYKSGFSIRRALISVSHGCISNWFELTTSYQQAERMLRSYLSIQTNVDADTTSLLWDRCQVPWSRGELRPDAVEARSPTSTRNKEFANVRFSNGDSYEGGAKIGEDGGERRHGYGTYFYAKDSHASFRQYRGQWKDDKKNGYGMLLGRNGAVYVGQWRENQRHGLGVWFDYQSRDSQNPSSMPSYRYEGQWTEDRQHGIGLEQSEEELYFGQFVSGQKSGRGVTMSFHQLGVSGCKVLDTSGTWRTLFEVLEGVALSEQAQVSPPASARQLPRRPSKDDLELLAMQAETEYFQSDWTTATPTPGAFGATAVGHFAGRGASPAALAASPPWRSEAEAPGAAGLPRPPSNGTLYVGQSPAAGSTPSQTLEAMFGAPSPPCTGLTTRRSGLFRQLSEATPPAFMLPTTGAVRRSSNTLRRRRAISCPMLWGEEELATFVWHLGVSAETADRIRRRRLRGAEQLLEMSNSEMEELGLETPLHRLLVRRCLQRLLDMDKLENSARGHSIRDVLADTVLNASIVPLEELTLLSRISQGGYGKVYRGLLRPSADRGPLRAGRFHSVAVKEMMGERRTQLYELLKEARVMASLHHPNVCSFIGVCADTQPLGKRYIISELMDCSLSDLVHRPRGVSWNGSWTLLFVLTLSKGIGAGIAYIHSMNLVHADLKSSNILVDLTRVPVPRICDFGHAAVRHFPAAHHLLGTPHWAAPEVLRGEALGPAADVFSFGVLLWEMLTRRHPHIDLSFGQVLASVGWAGLVPELKELPLDSPAELRNAVWECFGFFPVERPSMRKVLRRLRQLIRGPRANAAEMLSGFLS